MKFTGITHPYGEAKCYYLCLSHYFILPHVRFDCEFAYFNLLHNISIAIVNHLTNDIQISNNL